VVADKVHLHDRDAGAAIQTTRAQDIVYRLQLHTVWQIQLYADIGFLRRALLSDSVHRCLSDDGQNRRMHGWTDNYGYARSSLCSRQAGVSGFW